MELIIFSVRIVYWIFVWPVWWLSSQIAAIFYPFEGDSKHNGLALLICTLILMGVVVACVYAMGGIAE